MIYSLGCDVSKDNHVACLLRYSLATQKWDILSQKTFKNSSSGSKALVSWLLRLTNKQPAPIRCTMEATGVYYEQLALYLHAHAHKSHLSVVLPSTAALYISSRGLRNKTDKIDAFGLALLGAERLLEPWKGIDVYWRTLRELTRTRAGLVEQATVVRNQIHAQKHSGIPIKQVLQSLQRVSRSLEKESEKINQQICDHLQSREDLQEQIQCLTSIPGVGLKTIAVILAETLGFEYFQSVSQLMSFSGYDVVVNESGKRQGKRKISKMGSPFIRQAMYMPASTIVRRKPAEIYTIYDRLLSRHNIKMKAHVAVQKKLLTYMYTLWKSKQHYNPAIIEQQRVKHTVEKKVAPLSKEATVDTSNAAA